MVRYNELLRFLLSQQFIFRDKIDINCSGKLSVSYEDYIKCNIHLNTVSLFHKDRDIIDYYKSKKYLEGNTRYREEARRVLSYFYRDMSSLLLMDVGIETLELVVINHKYSPATLDGYDTIKSQLKDAIDMLFNRVDGVDNKIDISALNTIHNESDIDISNLSNLDRITQWYYYRVMKESLNANVL